MRNLKKVLTLVLTLAMLLSVMVVGAGAAFSDQDSIGNKEAVDVCTTLNIIGGYEDGTFRPAGNVTRAEMSKMICVALNGGQEPTMGSGLIATFNDVAKDNWAAPYIEYCVSQGIVGGVGGGNFNPNGNITGTQAAKMLLCILGYNASIQGYVGSDYWETNINVDAAQKGLYAGLSNVDASAPLTRDQAAQMIWNALNAYEVEYKTTLVAGPDGTLTSKVTVQDKVVNANNDKITLLEDKYEAKTFVGDFTGNSKMSGVSTKDGYIQVTGTVNSVGAAYTTPAKFPFDLDIKYIGEEVKVIYKDRTNEGIRNVPDDKDTIYGVYVTDTNTVINAIRDDIDGTYATAGKVSIDDKSYDVAETGKIVTDLGAVSQQNWTTNVADGKSKIQALAAVNGDSVKFILNDENKIESVYVTATTLNKVTAVSGTKISLTDIGTIDTAENGTSVYSGIAKDDVVTVTKLYKNSIDDATFVIEKAATVTGDVTGFSNAAAKNKSITMNGTVYSVYGETDMIKVTDDCKAVLTDTDLDKEFTLYLVNGYVRAAQEGADSMNQYAIVVERNSGKLDSTFNEPKAELLLADGNKVTAVIHKDSVIYTDNSDYTTPGNSGTTKLTSAGTLDSALGVNQIVKYTVMANGQYKIEECGTYLATGGTNVKLYDKDTTAFGAGTGTVTDGNCALFYTDGGKLKVANIRNLNTITAATTGTKYASATNSDGKVIAAFVDYNGKPSGASTDTMYGIITSDGTTTTKNGDTYTMFNVWTGEDVTVYVSGAGVNQLTKGALVSFDKSADDTYSQASKTSGDFNILDATNGVDNTVGNGDGKAVAVTEYNTTDNTLTYATSVMKEGNAFVADGKTPVAVDKDVKIVYIDAKGKKAGTSSGTVNNFDGTTGYANAMLVFEDDNDEKKVVAIFVNTNPDTDVLRGTAPAATAYTVTPANGSDTNGLSATVTANKATAIKGETITVTVELTGTANANSTIAASGSGVSGTISYAGPSGVTGVTVGASNVTVADTTNLGTGYTFTYTFTMGSANAAPSVAIS